MTANKIEYPFPRLDEVEDMDNCNQCNGKNFIEKSIAPHVGLYCADCGKFKKWIKQPDDDDGTPASEKQQNYALGLLRQWKQSGRPMTLMQAGGIIKLFKRKDKT